MNNEFIPYEQALALKELGFDEPCIKYFWTDGMFAKNYENPFNHNKRNNTISAPLYQQAFRWLLQKHNLYGIIIPTVTMDWTFKTMTAVIGMVEVPPYNHVEAYDYSSRVEAEQACLEKLIELVKNK
jgi:hypothetical protein